jgi:sodium-coupled monocarboxylate transporter 8/12
MFFGYLIMWTATFGTNQMAIQRYCSIGSMHDARLVLFGTMPVFLALASMSCFIGLIMLADFYECNPLETGAIHDRDQLVIVFAKKVLRM